MRFVQSRRHREEGRALMVSSGRVLPLHTRRSLQAARCRPLAVLWEFNGLLQTRRTDGQNTRRGGVTLFCTFRRFRTDRRIPLHNPAAFRTLLFIQVTRHRSQGTRWFFSRHFLDVGVTFHSCRQPERRAH